MSDAIDLLTIARHRLQALRATRAAADSAADPMAARMDVGCEISEISAETHLALFAIAETTALGEAGRGVPAWRCSVDLGTGHVMGVRADGSTFCSTCHPGVLAHRGVRPT